MILDYMEIKFLLIRIKSKISKGIFTTCKKRDKCPPWKIRAEEIEHDKNKKIINYKNAWLEIYDKPVFYFPRFFSSRPKCKKTIWFFNSKFK